MSHPDVVIGCVANLFSKMMFFAKEGDIEIGHTHNHDHLTLLAYGKLQVTVEGKTTIFNAPHMIYINKDKIHELVALKDNTVAYCIHALRDSITGDILDPSMIPGGVDAPSIAQAITSDDPKVRNCL